MLTVVPFNLHSAQLCRGFVPKLLGLPLRVPMYQNSKTASMKCEVMNYCTEADTVLRFCGLGGCADTTKYAFSTKTVPS